MEEKYLSPPDAARLLGKSVSTLAKWRCKGTGPYFIKKGGISYPLSKLHEYMQEGIHKSTSEYTKKGGEK